MGVDPAIDITTADLKTVLALLQRHLPGTAAWVYGSRVKWTSRRQSDLDLVVFATPAQRGQVGDLREAFEESNLPFRVDLFVWDDVPESFRSQIQNQHVALVNAQRARQKRDLSSWLTNRLMVSIGLGGQVKSGHFWRPDAGFEFCFTASCVRKVVTLVRQLRAPWSSASRAAASSRSRRMSFPPAVFLDRAGSA